MATDPRKVAFAVAAHPDDIEFNMAGTLMLLGQAGYELHYMNLADGACGSQTMTRQQTIRTRRSEAREAARLIGAVHHPSLGTDLEITYEPSLLRRLGSVIRRVNPTILLIPALSDYMEDHMITARLAVTAAFARGMRNYPVSPPVAPVEGELALYHAMPHGLRDGMRRRPRAGQYVDIASVLERKQQMLACHRSQQDWLDTSQGMNSYLQAMTDLSREVGRLSGRFKYAEGWCRHLHLGFSAREIDPLGEALGAKVIVDQRYEKSLAKS